MIVKAKGISCTRWSFSMATPFPWWYPTARQSFCSRQKLQSPVGERQGLEKDYLFLGQARKSSGFGSQNFLPVWSRSVSKLSKGWEQWLWVGLNYAGQLGNLREKSDWYLQRRQSSCLVSLDRKKSGRAGRQAIAAAGPVRTGHYLTLVNSYPSESVIAGIHWS